jgi:uncharacterized protein (UPF0332 family)
LSGPLYTPTGGLAISVTITLVAPNSKQYLTLQNLKIDKYYACFYAVSALLLYKSIKSNTHSGAKQMFQKHFIKEGIFSVEHNNFYNEIFEKRHKGDYTDFVDYNKSDIIDMLVPANKLINAIIDYITQ